jgi:TRAP-type C4-dicarboxylate transport system substrate-binding protein
MRTAGLASGPSKAPSFVGVDNEGWKQAAPMRMVVGACTGMLFTFAVGVAAAQTQWDLATNYASSAYHTRISRNATGGSLKIAVHPGGAMIKHAEIKKVVSDGKIAAGEILISLAADEAPVYGVDSIPFLATGYDGARKLYAAQKPYLEKRVASEGLLLLFSVDDLKGLKFRTYNAMTKRIAELSGAQPTQIEVPDLPAAFALGRVDVMITSASSGVQTKAEQYLTYYYMDAQAWLSRNMVFVNKAAFDKLTPAEQKAVAAAAQAAEQRVWELSIEEMTVKTTLKDAGITVLPPGETLKSGLAKIGATIAEESVASAGVNGQAMLAAYRK